MARLTFFGLLLLGLIGCANSKTNGPGGGGAEGGKKYTIAVIPKGTTHVFWKSVHYGAEQAAKELGNVEVLWKGPLTESDRETQIKLVEQFIARRVDGICLAPLDSRSLVDAVRQAKDAGIPTVIFDSGLEDESVLVSYVATDNYNGGVLAARRMAEFLGSQPAKDAGIQPKVILMRYASGSESTEQRERGFLETMEKEFPDIEILSSDQYTGTSPEQSLQKATEVLLKFKDSVGGIFGVCEPNADGILGALRQLEMTKKVAFIGFDPNENMVKALADHEMEGIVLQDPVKMGYLAVKTMVEHLEGKPVEKRIVTGEHCATPENMAEPLMDKLLHPPVEN